MLRCVGLALAALAMSCTAASPTTALASPAAVEVEAADAPLFADQSLVTTPATAVVAYAGASPAVHHVRTPARPSPLQAVSARYRVDPLLLESMVARESGFDPHARSAKGALGLMQVMPATARGLGVAEPARLLADPVLALATGAAYLKQLQGRFGNNVPLVLAAYNAGPGAVAHAVGVPPFAETRAYVGAVMRRYQTLRSARLR